MSKDQRKVAFVTSRGYLLKNARWSWGAVKADGILLLLGNEEQYIKRLGSTECLYWVCGGHPRDESHGGRERQSHVEMIRAGTRAKAAFYKPMFKDGKERTGRVISPELWRVVQVREPDEEGRAWALLEKEIPS